MRLLLLAPVLLFAACAPAPEVAQPDPGGARPDFMSTAALRGAGPDPALDPRADMAARIAALRARAATIRGDVISPELRARIAARRALQ